MPFSVVKQKHGPVGFPEHPRDAFFGPLFASDVTAINHEQVAQL